MKKSILFGALAIFAMSALGIQDATAQNADTKAKKAETTTMTEKKTQPEASNVAQEPVKQKKGDCCAEKKDAKKGDCCAEKKDMKKGDCKAEKKDMKKGDCCAEKKDCKHEAEKNIKVEGKKVKLDGKKDHKHPKHAMKPEGKMKKEQKEAGDTKK